MPLKRGLNNRPLREALDAVLRHHVGDDVGKQISEVENLASAYPHGITLVSAAVPEKPETFRFNCYQHSFDLVGVEPVNRIMRSYGSVYPGREFVQFLIDTQLSEISIEEAGHGDHVLYASGNELMHAGKITDEHVESKWGLMHLWRHGVYEVPWRYGSTTRFFKRLPQQDSVRAFLDYAELRGVTADE